MRKKSTVKAKTKYYIASHRELFATTVLHMFIFNDGLTFAQLTALGSPFDITTIRRMLNANILTKNKDKSVYAKKTTS